MSFPSRLLLLLALACAASGVTSAAAQRDPGGGRPDLNRDRQQFVSEVLREYNVVLADWQAAWRARDLRGVMRPYAETAMLLLPGEKPLQGRKEIEDFYRARLPNILELRTSLEQFDASGRVAYTSGRFVMETRAEGGGPQTSTGTYVAVLVGDGWTWKLASQVFYPDPEPAAAPAAAAAAQPQ